jgi:hypothetical protein
MLDGLEGRTPTWSPHDTLVEFESNRNCGKSKNYAIFVERPTGGRAHQLTDCAFNANHAVWSPDGKRLALAIELPGTGSLTPADGGDSQSYKSAEASFPEATSFSEPLQSVARN